MRSRLWVLWVAAAFAGACVGGSLNISDRFAAIHNAASAIGYGEVGPISEGSLAAGESVEVELALLGNRCYLVSALGGGGVWDLDLAIVDRTGSPIGSDASRGPQATLYVCPDSAGTYKARVQMVTGSGRWALMAWTGTGQGGGGFGAAGMGGGTCDSPLAVPANGRARGTTVGAADEMQPACLGPGESTAPDRVYRIELEQRGRLTATLTSQFDGVLSLLSECVSGDVAAIECNDDAQRGDTSHSRVSANLEPGTYYLVVDGYADAAGTFSLETRIEAMRDMSEVCGGLETLVSGQTVSGTTQGASDDFRSPADCAEGSRAPDTAYRLVIDRPSRVRIRLDSDYDGVLHLRSDCANDRSVAGCNDDFGQGQEALRISQIATRLQPGTYAVIVDGYEGENGTFRLTATVLPDGESPAENDACAGAETLVTGRVFRTDTFLASDDMRGSCVVEPGGADVVYRLEVPARSMLRVETTESDFPDPVYYLRRDCGSDASETACAVRSLSAVVDPGTWFLVVDGNRRDAIGSVAFRAELEDVSRIEAQCSEAPILESGRQTSGRTSGPDRFQGTCGDGTRNPEGIYQIRIRERSRVRITVEAEYDCVLYVRRSCVDSSSEVGCNDDAGEANRSELDLDLEPGTYFVFVDGYGQANESGSFRITADVTRR